MSLLLNATVWNDEELTDRLTTVIVTRSALNLMTSRQIALEVVDFLTHQRPKDWDPDGDAGSEEESEGEAGAA